MAVALKKHGLSNEDKTDEFQIPDLKLKSVGVPVQKVQALKTEHKNIAQEIIKAKEESARKEDESTRVFDLRQHDLTQKVKDLETKKHQVQKEIQALLQQKNSKLHEDISQATQTLVKETQDGMGKISNLRNELQHLFEQSSVDRKKNLTILESQATDIQAVSALVKECHTLMARDYVEASQMLKPLLEEKIGLEKAVVTAGLELARVEALSREFEIKKVKCEMALQELNKSIDEKVVLSIEANLTYEKHHASEKAINKSLGQAHSELQDYKLQNEKLQIEIELCQENLETLQKSSQHLQLSFEALNEQYDHKKKTLHQTERNVDETKHRLEALRSQEIELMRSCANYTSTLSQIQTEISVHESTRSAAQKLQDDAIAFFYERREYYAQEVKTLELFHEDQIEVLKTGLDQQKASWNNEFQEFVETKKMELEAQLEAKTVAHNRVLQENQNILMDDVLSLVKRHLTRTVFESGQVKSEMARDELEPVLANYFNNTLKRELKPWQKWKNWMAATAVCSTIIFGLCLKIYLA